VTAKALAIAVGLAIAAELVIAMGLAIAAVSVIEPAPAPGVAVVIVSVAAVSRAVLWGIVAAVLAVVLVASVAVAPAPVAAGEHPAWEAHVVEAAVAVAVVVAGGKGHEKENKHDVNGFRCEGGKVLAHRRRSGVPESYGVGRNTTNERANRQLGRGEVKTLRDGSRGR
jgi:hypothetical protein